MTPLQKARNDFQNDRFATEATGIVIEAVEEGYAKCSLALTPIHQNAVGHVMGGVIFTLADFTFAVAANFDQPTPTVTAVSNVSFLSSPKGKTLFGESRRIKDGKRSCFYEILITDDLGTQVALVTVNGVHLN
jgi:acyl-CoA thioesterase